MGFFGTYRYDGTRWHELPRPDLSPAEEPWLLVYIHDSDVGMVHYRPTGTGSGVAYLGHTPRTYFDDPGASAPTDVAREAAALAAWWALARGGVDPDAVAAKERELAGYLAADEDPDADEPLDGDGGDDEPVELDDADIFVEVKVSRFVLALGLPDLPEPDLVGR
ncbi:hypothetical protein [Catellatospora tritici]|uniref:hypothetical protein n=1 Tax=Catellatospora tritici TaxID=2851566 RepID=UPI001C2D9EEB|nr:hypothetical protein [Catellatospora tritici]MBV1853022.1 hypothetical protein [Catellatospora tritici]